MWVTGFIQLKERKGSFYEGGSAHSYPQLKRRFPQHPTGQSRL
jgi:hypothetical protein